MSKSTLGAISVPTLKKRPRCHSDGLGRLPIGYLFCGRKKELRANARNSLILLRILGGRGGIKPPTQGFSKTGSTAHACTIRVRQPSSEAHADHWSLQGNPWRIEFSFRQVLIFQPVKSYFFLGSIVLLSRRSARLADR